MQGRHTAADQSYEAIQTRIAALVCSITAQLLVKWLRRDMIEGSNLMLEVLTSLVKPKYSLILFK